MTENNPKKNKISFESFHHKQEGHQTVATSKVNMLKMVSLFKKPNSPLLVQANLEGLDIYEIIKENKQFVYEKVVEHGGLLFRGFDIASQSDFGRFVDAFKFEKMDYNDQHTPRTKLDSTIYTSTEYPAGYQIPFHSENSKNSMWPRLIWFNCQEPSPSGGQTPIAYNHLVYNSLSPCLRDRFERKGVLYVRNYGHGIGLSWQKAFSSSNKIQVEKKLKAMSIKYSWRKDGTLHTELLSHATILHPEKKQKLWFNQANLFHISTLDKNIRETLVSTYEDGNLPCNVYYGDGSIIEDEIITQIHQAYEASSLKFDWQAKDILMLDNMQIAHGRMPFEGTRKVLVSMAKPYVVADATADNEEAHLDL